MPKFLKNSIISSETVYLVKTQTEANNPNESLDNSQTLISESEIETIQQESFQKGYISGKNEAKTLIEQEMVNLKHQLESALLAIPQAIAKNRLELNTEIADIVLLISQQFFINKELKPQALEQQINQILVQINDNQSIELHLHPVDIDSLQKGLIKLDTTHTKGLKIMADETLALGGYIIKTNHGIYDASVEKQIDKLKTCLLEIRQRGHHAALD